MLLEEALADLTKAVNLNTETLKIAIEQRGEIVAKAAELTKGDAPKTRRTAAKPAEDDAPKGRRRAAEDEEADLPKGRRRAEEDEGDAPRGRRRAAEEDEGDAPRSRRRSVDDDDEAGKEVLTNKLLREKAEDFINEPQDDAEATKREEFVKACRDELGARKLGDITDPEDIAKFLGWIKDKKAGKRVNFGD